MDFNFKEKFKKKKFLIKAMAREKPVLKWKIIKQNIFLKKWPHKNELK